MNAKLSRTLSQTHASLDPSEMRLVRRTNSESLNPEAKSERASAFGLTARYDDSQVTNHCRPNQSSVPRSGFVFRQPHSLIASVSWMALTIGSGLRRVRFLAIECLLAPIDSHRRYDLTLGSMPRRRCTQRMAPNVAHRKTCIDKQFVTTFLCTPALDCYLTDPKLTLKIIDWSKTTCLNKLSLFNQCEFNPFDLLHRIIRFIVHAFEHCFCDII